MLHWSIVTHAKACEGALGALWVERSSGRSLLPAGHVGAVRSEAKTAGIRFGIMSANADPNPAPSLASET